MKLYIYYHEGAMKAQTEEYKGEPHWNDALQEWKREGVKVENADEILKISYSKYCCMMSEAYLSFKFWKQKFTHLSKIHTLEGYEMKVTNSLATISPIKVEQTEESPTVVLIAEISKLSSKIKELEHAEQMIRVNERSEKIIKQLEKEKNELNEALRDIKRIITRMANDSLENAEDLDLTEIHDIIEALNTRESK